MSPLPERVRESGPFGADVLLTLQFAHSTPEPTYPETVAGSVTTSFYAIGHVSHRVEYMSVDTSKRSINDPILALQQLHVLATHDAFDDGQRGLVTEFISKETQQSGRAFPFLLAHWCVRGMLDGETAAQSLRTLGRVRDETTRDAREWALCHALQSRRALVRDGALLGLLSHGDPRVIPIMQEALDKETIPELRVELNAAIEELSSLPDATAEKNK